MIEVGSTSLMLPDRAWRLVRRALTPSTIDGRVPSRHRPPHDPFCQATGPSGGGLAPFLRFFQSATFGASHLARVQEEMIATAVSSLNRCHY